MLFPTATNRQLRAEALVFSRSVGPLNVGASVSGNRDAGATPSSTFDVKRLVLFGLAINGAPDYRPVLASRPRALRIGGQYQLSIFCHTFAFHLARKAFWGPGWLTPGTPLLGDNGSNNADQDRVGRGCGGSGFGSRDLGCVPLR